jgi:hypothetical protein
MRYGCLKCGYQWEGRLKVATSIPKACPDCKIRGTVVKLNQGATMEIEIPISELKKARKLLKQFPQHFKDLDDVLNQAQWRGLIYLTNQIAADKNWTNKDWKNHVDKIVENAKRFTEPESETKIQKEDTMNETQIKRC